MRWQRIASIGAPPLRPETDADHAHRAALENGDEVVQQLAIAKYALTIGDTECAMAAIDAALEQSRHSLAGLLETVRPRGLLSFAGTLVRTIAAASNGDGRPRPAPVAAERVSAPTNH